MARRYEVEKVRDGRDGHGIAHYKNGEAVAVPPNQKRRCEEMRIHFFTSPFYFAFIWFRVQGSGLSWRLRRNYIWGDARSRIILAPSSGRGRRAKRGGVGIPACESTVSRANLRPFGAPPFKGRREKSGMRNECGEAATLIPHFLETLHLISADFHPRNN